MDLACVSLSRYLAAEYTKERKKERNKKERKVSSSETLLLMRKQA
jgi:hypothetical protein